MSKEIVSVTGNTEEFSKVMKTLGSKIQDFSPVTEKIRSSYLVPLAARSWSASGLHSRTGDLHAAVTPFSGKMSIGIGLRTNRGKDLILAKAATHTFGRKKFSNKRGKNWKRLQFRKRSPWGDIPARRFIPVSMPRAVNSWISTMVIDYIRNY